jgi:hypothetical protein
MEERGFYEKPGLKQSTAEAVWRIPGPCTMITWRYVDEEVTRAGLRPLAMGILRCNKVVGQEAARVFYTKNTFSFEGQHNYDPIVAWLQAIGSTNRDFLTSMEISAGRPDYGWQRSNGERRRDPAEHGQEEIYPRHPYLQLRAGEGRTKYGRVDNINPAVETIFVLLGQRESEGRLKIIMQLTESCYPGVRTPRVPDDTDPDSGWYSMGLPNLIEKFRSLHTRNVEVLWKGQDCRQELEDQREALEGMGWEVKLFAAKQDILHPHPEWYGCHPATNEWTFAKFVLKGRELTGTLWAQYPCPFSFIDPDSSPDFC